MNVDDLVLDIVQTVEVNAAIGDVFNASLRRLGADNQTPDGEPMPLVLEEWPGGRWFRDLGNKQGHLWGFVQVIKPPNLIEISGPMFMSYPVSGHVALRMTQISGGTRLDLRHQALGLIQKEHREGVVPGWAHILECIKESAE